MQHGGDFVQLATSIVAVFKQRARCDPQVNVEEILAQLHRGGLEVLLVVMQPG